MTQLFEILRGALSPDMPRELGFGLSSAGIEKFGQAWRDAFASEILPHVPDDHQRAQLLRGWSLDRATWAYVDALGETVSQPYWKDLGTPPIHGTTQDFLEAIDRFRQLGRHLDVLAVIQFRHQDISTAVLIDLLNTGIGQIDQAVADRMGNMLPYRIEKALDILRERDDVDEGEIAGLEYVYLPLMQFTYEPQTLTRLITSDANHFVAVISHIYRSTNDPTDLTVTPQIQRRAENSHRLLSRIKRAPGQALDGSINAPKLHTWVTSALALAAEQGLTDPCLSRIGRLLAHSPHAPGEVLWPPAAVCQLVETNASRILENAFLAECIEKRGGSIRAPDEGGNQERALATRYQAWADAAYAFARTSAVLQEIADIWERSSSGEDTRAELRKLKP